MAWTKKNIPNIEGKIAIVTGGNSGLGFHSVRLLAEAGATVVLACRSEEKGKRAASKIQARVDVMSLDLESFESIEDFALAFAKKYDRLDILINNAGIMIPPFAIAPCGVERQMAVNHLGHFKLVYHLLPLLKNTKESRVVSVSSLAHRKGVLNLTDINYDNGKTYDAMEAYRRSKLANLLFVYGLQRFFEENKIDSHSIAAHPGVSPTNLVNHKISTLLRWFIRPLAALFLQPPKIGALAQVRAAVDSSIEGGQFLGPSSRSEWRGSPVCVEAQKELVSDQSISDLWHFSEQVCKLKYN